MLDDELASSSDFHTHLIIVNFDSNLKLLIFLRRFQCFQACSPSLCFILYSPMPHLYFIPRSPLLDATHLVQHGSTHFMV